MNNRSTVGLQTTLAALLSCLRAAAAPDLQIAVVSLRQLTPVKRTTATPVQ